jgi:hypothetical protein
VTFVVSSVVAMEVEGGAVVSGLTAAAVVLINASVV